MNHRGQEQGTLQHSNNDMAIAFCQCHGTTILQRCQGSIYCILRLVIARQQRQQDSLTPAGAFAKPPDGAPAQDMAKTLSRGRPLSHYLAVFLHPRRPTRHHLPFPVAPGQIHASSRPGATTPKIASAPEKDQTEFDVPI